MRVSIIDKNHIMIHASASEMEEYSNYSRILVDDKYTFVCSSEPSSKAYTINRPEEGTLFNVPLDLSYSAFSTEDLLIIFVEMDDLTYPFVIPCYDNEKLMQFVADKTGMLDALMGCKCNNDISMVYPIILYYGFKLALATFDIKTAIKYWDWLFGPSDNPALKCGCNGK